MGALEIRLVLKILIPKNGLRINEFFGDWKTIPLNPRNPVEKDLRAMEERAVNSLNPGEYGPLLQRRHQPYPRKLITQFGEFSLSHGPDDQYANRKESFSRGRGVGFVAYK